MPTQSGFKFLVDFELIDQRGEPLYLIFDSNHCRDLEKLKDSAWEVDRVYAWLPRPTRRASRNAVRDDRPGAVPLGRLLVNHLKHASETAVRAQALREFALFETVYRREHVIRTLQ